MWWNLTLWHPYQLFNFRLQVLYAVEFPLAAALGGNPVLTPPPDVMDTVQLFWSQLVHPQQGLEVIPREGNDPLCVKWQLYLERETSTSHHCCALLSHSTLGDNGTHVTFWQGGQLGATEPAGEGS